MNTIRMTYSQHQQLLKHLFPGDSKEAIAVALCGRGGTAARPLWTLHRIVEIPYSECDRGLTFVKWPTWRLRELLRDATREQMALLKIHSHPTGYRYFSKRDDESDGELFEAIGRRISGDQLSAIMLPDGSMFARIVNGSGIVSTVNRISTVGDDVTFFDFIPSVMRRDFDVRHRQMFGDRTTSLLAALSIGVVGVSGTGSPTIEMLMRLGVGRLILIDPDAVEHKNLNRIYGATRIDAEKRCSKVEMMKTHIEATGLGTVVEISNGRIDTTTAATLLTTCDAVFGCVDSIEGRDTLNRLATFYSLPYLDLGVRLDADGVGGVDSISAGVHYLQPGGSSLKTRGLYCDRELYAEFLKRTDPAFYEDQLQRGYIRGVKVDRPAVISINTATAAAAVNELLARLHPFRISPNSDFAVQKLLFTHGRTTKRGDGEPDLELRPFVGRGNCNPMLFSSRMEKAA